MREVVAEVASQRESYRDERTVLIRRGLLYLPAWYWMLQLGHRVPRIFWVMTSPGDDGD